MKTNIIIAIMSSALATSTSCMSAINPEAKPSALDKWETVPVVKFGFNMEVPKDRRGDWVSNAQFEKSAGHGLYSFALHPIRIGPGIEDRYLIEVYVISMTSDQYRLICEEGNRSSYARVFGGTLHLFHPQAKEYNLKDATKEARVFRRDFSGKGGQVVAVSAVRYNYIYGKKLEAGDIAAIERILSSVKFKSEPNSDNH